MATAQVGLGKSTRDLLFTDYATRDFVSRKTLVLEKKYICFVYELLTFSWAFRYRMMILRDGMLKFSSKGITLAELHVAFKPNSPPN